MTSPPLMPQRKRPRTASAIVNVVVCAALIAVIVSMALNDRFRWDVIGSYLFDATVFSGIGTTLLLTAVVTVISVVAGCGVALLVMHGSRSVVLLASGYIWLFRSIPNLVLLLVTFNLGALYPTFFGVSVNDLITPFAAAIIALSLHETAFMAEVIRSGLLSVPAGQTEAAAALGMRPAHQFFRIIAPQAARIALPPLGNEVIGLLKSTSIVSVIAVSDLLYSVQLIYAKNFQTIPLLIVATFWYIVLVGAFSFLQSRLEARLARSSRVRAVAPVKVIA